MENAQSVERVPALGGVRTAGLLCTVGGAGWVAIGVVSAFVGRIDGAAFVVSELSWLVVQSLLLVGVVGLALSGAAPGWFGGIALGIALLGRVDFVVAEIHSLAIGEDSILLPLGAMITAVGMTLVGVAVLRARRWEGWRKFTPLVAGVYPFVGMFPFIFIANEPNILAIAVWGLAWLALGYALYSTPRSSTNPKEVR
ncbi:MAG: hypothetical protein ACRDSJ_08700 [Rubrobacteraceae bacterium]